MSDTISVQSSTLSEPIPVDIDGDMRIDLLGTAYSQGTYPILSPSGGIRGMRRKASTRFSNCERFRLRAAYFADCKVALILHLMVASACLPILTAAL